MDISIFFLLKIFPKLSFRFRFFRYLERLASLSQGKGWGFGTIPEEVNASLSLLKIKPKIFIDIGAWIGPYTLVAAKLGMRVFAFEPDKIAFEVLKKNIQLNEFKYKPEIYNFGLSKKETIAYLYSNTNAVSYTHLTLPTILPV